MKLRAYDALKRLGVAPVSELADAAKTTPDRILAVMMGDGEDYRNDTSLVALRVAEPRETSGGLAFALTIRGNGAHGLVRARLAR